MENEEPVKIRLSTAVKRIFATAQKLGVIFQGYTAIDYLRHAINIHGWECTTIDGVKGQAKSNLLLQRGYAIYENWDTVFENLVFEPIQFLDLISSSGRIPWIGWDDLTVHLPSTLYFTDRDMWAELSSNWAAYRTKLSCFDCTAPRKDRVVGFILDDMTGDITCFNRYKDVVSHYDFQRWIWQRNLKDPKKKTARPVLVEEVAFPLTPGALKITPELMRGKILSGGTQVPRTDFFTLEKSGLIGIPRPIFKRYWKRRLELADKAAKRSRELFLKRGRTMRNSFEVLVDEVKERKEEFLQDNGLLDVTKIHREFGIGRTKAYEIIRAVKQDH